MPMAPAVRIDEFQEFMSKELKSGRCPKPTMYILNKQQEEDDSVGPYGKYLLWLVSRAFEDKRDTPILGCSIISTIRPRPRVCWGGLVVSPARGKQGVESESKTHGGFDNDPYTMNSVLFHILGQAPRYAFEQRDLDY